MKRTLTDYVEKTPLVTNHLRKSLTMSAMKPFAAAIDQRDFEAGLSGENLRRKPLKQIQMNLLNAFLKVIC